MDATTAFKILSPMAWLAMIAFLVGFIGYLALGAPQAFSHGKGGPQAEMASGPASDDWNIPKEI